jgi:hypothetical protein
MSPRGRHEPVIITIRAPGAKAELTKADVITILQALGDAEGWRRRRVDQWWPDARTLPRAGATSTSLIWTSQTPTGSWPPS